jgi:hypothetical protein
MNTRTVEIRRSRKHLPFLAALVGLSGAVVLPGTALGQDWRAMYEQQGATVAAAQQQAYQIVRQKMQDPQVQAAYRQYLAQAAQSGTQPWNFPTFAYYYAATGGFSDRGKAAWYGSERAIQANEQRAWQGVREAEAARQGAQTDLQAGYSRNQQEAGRQLLGQSTFVNPQGQTQALPHTWQRNTSYTYQGNTYHVDESGQYWMRDPNNSGYWIPLRPAR